MRVLHAPVNVGNQPWVLSRYERRLGIRSDVAVNYNTWLGYQADYCLSGYGDKSVASVARRLSFGLLAPFRYDVLHFYFGRSLLCWDDYGPRNRIWFMDLRIARLLGRKIIMTLQGCDSRLSAESARQNEFTPCTEGECRAAKDCRATYDTERRYMIDNILPMADRVFVLNPELAHYVRNAVFLPYANVDVEAIEPVWPSSEGPITIVHAPSDPSTKGSKYIVSAVERLKSVYPINFIQVQGIPHAEAVRIYRTADLVIDQVLYGWYGGFAVEAMAMGKPVICYIRDADLKFVPEKMLSDLPVLRTTPTTLDTDLRRIVQTRQMWNAIGRKCREFVLKWHHPERIARAMFAAYRHPDCVFDLE